MHQKPLPLLQSSSTEANPSDVFNRCFKFEQFVSGNSLAINS